MIQQRFSYVHMLNLTMHFELLWFLYMTNMVPEVILGSEAIDIALVCVLCFYHWPPSTFWHSQIICGEPALEQPKMVDVCFPTSFRCSPN